MRRTDKVVVVGPYPPPEHGTSLPFRELVQYLEKDGSLRVEVINTQSGDKAGMHLLNPNVMLPGVKAMRQFVKSLTGASFVVIYGSQRFCATFGIASEWLCRSSGIPCCMYIQGGGFDRFLSSRNPVWQLVIINSFRNYKRIFLQTRLLCEEAGARLGNVEQIPNWIAERWMESSRLAPQIPVQGRRCMRFMFLGEVREEKGVGVLIEAFRRLRQGGGCNAEAVLTIFGPIRADYGETFSRLMTQVPSGITYGGELSNERVQKALWDHDALVLPTYFPSEGYPGVILEAMSQRRVVITTRWRAIPEIAVHDRTALVCDPHDCDGLFLALTTCIERPDLCRRLVDSACEQTKRLTTSAALAPMRRLIHRQIGAAWANLRTQM